MVSVNLSSCPTSLLTDILQVVVVQACAAGVPEGVRKLGLRGGGTRSHEANENGDEFVESRKACHRDNTSDDAVSGGVAVFEGEKSLRGHSIFGLVPYIER